MTAAHAVFVYGTLTDPDRAASVLEGFSFGFRGRATLHGLHRVEGEYPTLAPGGRVDGRLLGVDDAGLEVLDDYEAVDRGLYARVSLPWFHPAAESDTVWTYVGEPDRLGADAEWPGEGPFDERVRTVIGDRGAGVGPRHDRSAE